MTCPDLTAQRNQFTTALCKEHLDEAAFLYSQCRHLLTAPDGPWTRALTFEQRQDAHLDALAMEGEIARKACQERAESTDPGDYYTAARIFCRHNRPGPIGRIMETLPADDTDKTTAVCSALVHEAFAYPQRVLDILTAHPGHGLITATVAADSRLTAAWPLVKTTPAQPAGTLAQVLRLAGRTGQHSATDLLSRALDHEDPGVRQQAALGLLRLGHARDVIRHARSGKLLVPALGLAGGSSEAALLMELAQSGPPDPDLLTSLGLLGDITAAPVLIRALDNQDLAASAAQALDLITGAGEEIYTSETEEPEKHRHGKDPHPSSQTPEAATSRLSQNPDHWRRWLDDNQHRFDPPTRYRHGRPHGPKAIIGTLQSPTAPSYLRQLAYEELVIRYAKDIPFEAHWPASVQIRAIDAYRRWAQTAHSAFDPGRWYLAGRPINLKETPNGTASPIYRNRPRGFRWPWKSLSQCAKAMIQNRPGPCVKQYWTMLIPIHRMYLIIAMNPSGWRKPRNTIMTKSDPPYTRRAWGRTNDFPLPGPTGRFLIQIIRIACLSMALR